MFSDACDSRSKITAGIIKAIPIISRTADTKARRITVRK